VTVTSTLEPAVVRARRSTIVWKIAMAVTGIVFIAYVLAHMYGNLKVFGGQSAFDGYAEHLRELGTPILPHAGALWIIRVVLLVSLVVHAVAAYRLWARAAGARSQRYAVKKATKSTLSSRTMRWGGTALLLFIVFHLLNLTTRTITPGGDSDSPYQRMLNTFAPENWYMTVIYLLAMVALGMHLRHGVFSAAQTLGYTTSQSARAFWNRAGWAVAIVVAGGFALVPTVIILGLVPGA
jgi:succinate dehydrogenase / fumarate reductase cytochrome b subunit